ncbi:hypothetical protein CPB86DRAFT_787036 [Serendipita vermifera]|nr:hypothetical protein CPB86DRAFT_787036 [Serendipita vermifera]
MMDTSSSLPGSTLKRMIREAKYMSQLIDLLKRRLELERRYLDELKSLSKSVNPKWLQSGIALLATPVTDLFENEIGAREEACNSMEGRFKQLKEFDHRDEYIVVVSDGSSLDQYASLVSAGQAHEACQEEASSEKAVGELKRWYIQEPSTSDPSLASTEDLERFLLPLAERKYRKSVIQQQANSVDVSRWHNQVLPTLFEPHQQYSENVKEFVRHYCNINCTLAMSSVRQLETTKSNIEKFSSSKFIAENHEQSLLEATHRFMKPTEYVDFVTGERSSTVIFGTDLVSPAIKVAISLMAKRNMNLEFKRLPTKAKSLQLERRLKPQSTLKKSLKPFSDSELETWCSFGLLSNPPLIPILIEEAKRYDKGIPRGRLAMIMDPMLPNMWILRALVGLGQFESIGENWARLVTHRQESSRIILDICCKWDFDNHCPLPPGVKRSVANGKLFLARMGFRSTIPSL